MKKRFILISSVLLMMAASAKAQELKSNYINWGKSSDEFGQMLTDWKVGDKITEDDNFFISRVKPRVPFRNAKTQVRTDITAENDKRLVAWVPVNDPSKNGLPDGIFDSEVFSMWNYVTHWGNWTAPLGRVPAAFLDVAHKNGVTVTSVASVPNASLISYPKWEECLTKLGNVAPEKAAKFFNYYGVNGLGYNSEFSSGRSVVQVLHPFHKKLYELASKQDPLFENMWYDGTTDNGFISFDQGLGSHNEKNFGINSPAASLFFNYNWNKEWLLKQSVENAQKNGRDPLYLYAGFNMQGKEPRSGERWPMLAKYPISIGLWGAHQRNMWWESRGEKGSAPEVQQRTYMLRTERWFTGGTRNPINTPEVTSSMDYHADNYTFHGMSSFMSARSTLKWDLAAEPFITYFNLGNGKYFNWQGKQQNNREWYNVGVQDYLPTWRWWFSNQFLGRDRNAVPTNLNAEFTWDEAYVGGSSLRIYGSGADQYLHLFKTEYALQAGDVITVTYKLKNGKTDLKLALSALNSEETVVDESKYSVIKATEIADEDLWQTRSFTVGEELAGKSLALVALHLQNTDNVNLYLGQFAITRAAAATPAKPIVESTKMLAFSRQGVDGKIIFKMDNNKPKGEVCYNIDVNTSMFKLYAQQEGKEPVFMGLTTSWAGMFYNIPLELTAANARIRLGVAALSLDHKTQSDIAWGEYQEAGSYAYNDDITISKTTIKPNEAFEMSFVDLLHEEGTWELFDLQGKKVFSAKGNSVKVEGLKELGSYDLVLTAPHYDAQQTARPETTRRFTSFVQITGEGVGALPEIYTLTANEKTENVDIKVNEKVAFAYTGRNADGAGSQGVQLEEKRFGVKVGDLSLQGKKSFGVAFWIKINKLAAGETQLLSVASKKDGWPKTDWGWIWCNVKADGTMGSFTFRGTDATSNNEFRCKFADTKIPVGNWVHIAYNFEYNGTGGFRTDFYVNGVKQKLTAWNRTKSPNDKTQDPGYQPDVYSITAEQMIAVGGSAHGRSGIDGIIDNFQIWDNAITADDVKVAMGDLPAQLPANLKAAWTFEEKANDNFFKSVGSMTNVQSGLHEYRAEGGEGQGRIVWVAPNYTSGCPFISGTAYPVETKPSWKAKKAVITDAKGTGTAGSANIAFLAAGEYDVTLTLSNPLGSASKTFSVVKVGEIAGIANAEAAEIRTQVVGEDVLIEFAQAGHYQIALYNLAGQLVAQKAAHIANSSNVQLRLGQAGTYLLKVTQAGKAVHTVKLLKH